MTMHATLEIWQGTLRTTSDLPAAKRAGDNLLLVIYKLHNVNSRSSYTCAYLDDHAADDLRWHNLGGFVMHPDFTDQQDHQAYWIEVASLERDTLMVMQG